VGAGRQIEWVEIPAGEFLYGLRPEVAQSLFARLPERFKPFEKNTLIEETPEKKIHIDTFYISRFPITWDMFLDYCESDDRYSYTNMFVSDQRKAVLEGIRKLAETKANYPACTGWHHAFAFCNYIGARLPTSAEWEKAARGTDGRLYPWGNEWDAEKGNFSRNKARWATTTSPVDAYPLGQSPYGVMDMMGNADEYTQSTMVGATMELAIGRGCSCDFDADIHLPDWYRNRVTACLPHPLNGFLRRGGFRPVLDEWQRQYWPG